MEHNAYIGNPTFESYIDQDSPLDMAYKSKNPYFKYELLKQGATNKAQPKVTLLSIKT